MSKKAKIIIETVAIINLIILSALIYINIKQKQELENLKYSYNEQILEKEKNISKLETDLKSKKDSNEDNYIVEYYEEEGKCYIIEKNQKVSILTPEQATKIAEEEAKKDKYQIYDNKKMEFKASSFEKLMNSIGGASYIFDEQFKTDKYVGGNQLMWEIGLSATPTTTLYIYVDATTGDVLGAGRTLGD